jgi:hypothetical protein
MRLGRVGCPRVLVRNPCCPESNLLHSGSLGGHRITAVIAVNARLLHVAHSCMW